jgi:hypothetical protein
MGRRKETNNGKKKKERRKKEVNSRTITELSCGNNT